MRRRKIRYLQKMHDKDLAEFKTIWNYHIDRYIAEAGQLLTGRSDRGAFAYIEAEFEILTRRGSKAWKDDIREARSLIEFELTRRFAARVDPRLALASENEMFRRRMEYLSPPTRREEVSRSA